MVPVLSGLFFHLASVLYYAEPSPYGRRLTAAKNPVCHPTTPACHPELAKDLTPLTNPFFTPDV